LQDGTRLDKKGIVEKLYENWSITLSLLTQVRKGEEAGKRKSGSKFRSKPIQNQEEGGREYGKKDRDGRIPPLKQLAGGSHGELKPEGGCEHKTKHNGGGNGEAVLKKSGL